MKLSDASIPSLLFEETADASISTPAANKIRLFLDDDGILKWKDETGTVYEVAGSSGAVATDAIWDTKGDLAVATGANAASKLVVGTNGQVLTADSGEATGTKWATPAVGFENLRGTIAANGTIIRGTGFTASQTATGKYTIAFTSPMSAIPIIIVSAEGDGSDGTKDVSVESSTAGGYTPRATTGFKVRVTNPTGGAYQDCIWDFIAMVP